MSGSCSFEELVLESLGSGTVWRPPSKQTESSSLSSLGFRSLTVSFNELVGGKKHSMLLDLIWFMSHSSRKCEFGSSV